MPLTPQEHISQPQPEPQKVPQESSQNAVLGCWPTALVFSGIGFGVIFWIMSWLDLFSAMSWWMRIGITLFLVIILWMVGLAFLKFVFLQALPDHFAWRPAEIATEKWPATIDIVAIDQLTETFINLGFQHLQEYCGEGETSSDSPGYVARLLAHPQHHCFVEIGQTLGEYSVALPTTYSIHSLLEEGWEFSTMQQKPNSILWMWHNPKAVGIFAPSLEPDALLQLHLERRQQMAQDLGLDVFPDMSWDTFVMVQERSTIGNKQRLRRKPVAWALLEATLFELNPQYEWLGDYGKVATKAPKQRS